MAYATPLRFTGADVVLLWVAFGDDHAAVGAWSKVRGRSGRTLSVRIETLLGGRKSGRSRGRNEEVRRRSRSKKAQRDSGSNYRAGGRRGDDGHGGALTRASKLPHRDTAGHLGRLLDGRSLKCLSVSEGLLLAGLQVVQVSLELFAVSAATFDFKECRNRR